MKFKVFSEKNGDITGKHDWFVSPSGKLYSVCEMTGDMDRWDHIIDEKQEGEYYVFVLK